MQFRDAAILGNDLKRSPRNMQFARTKGRGRYEDVVLADGPVRYWPLNDTRGTLVRELAANATDMSHTSAVQVNSVPLPSGMTGRAAYYPGGSTNSWTSGWSRTATGAVTLEAWAFYTYLSPGTANIGSILSFNTSFQGSLEIRSVGPQFTVVDVTPTGVVDVGLATKQWVHVVLSHSGSVMTGYFNGTYAGQTSVGLNSTSLACYIGTLGAEDTTRQFTGAIAHAAFYTYALTAQQVRNHYSMGKRDYTGRRF